ncbi:MAG: EAL domain-containing protein [Lysobacterales bacterium]
MLQRHARRQRWSWLSASSLCGGLQAADGSSPSVLFEPGLMLLLGIAALVALTVILGVIRRRREQRAYVEALRRREDRLQLSLWGSGDGFWDWNIADNELHREGLDRVLGMSESSLVVDLEDWKTGEVHPDDLPAVNDRIFQHIKGHTDHYESEHRLRSPNGQWVWVLARGKVAERDAQGVAIRVSGTVRNIEQERRQQHDARVAAEVIRTMSEAVAVLDQQGRFSQVNPAFEEVTGYPASELIGRAWDQLECDSNDPAQQQQRDAAMAQRCRTGQERLLATSVTQVRDHDSEAPYFIVVQNDITERYRSEQELRFLANYDPLTGLANRTLLMQRVGSALEEAKVGQTGLALLFMDLDRFKQINDSLGHAVGDELLRAVGARMRAALPFGTFLARQGGDEFTILLEGDADAATCETIARSLLQAFRLPIRVRGNEVSVTPSIGIAQFPTHADNPADLLRFADGAMYAAKSAGRNTFRFFQHEIASGSRISVALEQCARVADGLGEFRLHYQPIYCVYTRRPLAVEALLRWSHAELGEVGPEVFVPLLEESGSIVNVGRQVVREALRQIAAWRREGLPTLKVAVNLSTLQLLRAELCSDIHAALAEAGLPGRALELELTETLLMSNPEQAIRTLAELKGLGVSIAVDDFGTGYSSLSYLKRLPIDKLKIDREFIGDLQKDPDDAVIVETILAMARALQLRATGEGVEEPAQLRFLENHRCEEVQGFLLCRPLPADDCLRELLRAQAAADAAHGRGGWHEAEYGEEEEETPPQLASRSQ